MSLWIDKKYCGMLSSKLERFDIKQKTPYLANCRCPICGDSKKNKFKTRGYVFEKKGGLFYKCHNCSFSTSIGKFIKRIDEMMYKQYVMERYKEAGHHRQSHSKVENVFDFAKPQFEKRDDALSFATKVNNTPAEKYLQDRQIPKERWSELYYVDDVSKIECLSEKYKDRIVGNDKRLLLPFYNRKNNLVGVTCRAIEDSKLRYIALRIDENAPMIYNLNKVDFTKTVYVTEGPIDSLFLDNAVAVGNSDLKAISNALPKDKVVLIFDNQPRNRELVDIMERSIDVGYSLVIWPDNIKEKDINEMVSSGLVDIQKIINENTFKGLQLVLAFNKWKKI